MPTQRHITHEELTKAANSVAVAILTQQVGKNNIRRGIRVYPVPRGGVPAYYLVERAFATLPDAQAWKLRLELAGSPEEADVIIDDLLDSGTTARRLKEANPEAQFEALFVKGSADYPKKDWLVFPWEGTAQGSAEDIFIRLLQYVGEDPARGGLIETPARMAKAWEFWCSGYNRSPGDILKTFEDGGEQYNEMVHTAGIPFYSQCEHHLAPFFGTVAFAYVPDKRIVGLSKMDRLVDIFARRLQVQERLTTQVLDAFCDVMKPRGAGIVVRARHLCMESRGVCHQGMVTTTSAFRGVLFDQPAARAEFFSLTNHGN